tara:strand:- start:45128 stop:45583 length:456 start_codon:yes stop_codon:yes gene_type:complete
MHINILNKNEKYAGDISPTEGWNALSQLKESALVDVRTSAELNFVGQPDLSNIGKKTINIELQHFPGGVKNVNFVQQLEDELINQNYNKDSVLLFICRSGARSATAASLMHETGWINSFNIAFGFEGDPDQNHHRGVTNGWKYEDLPWIQQ